MTVKILFADPDRAVYGKVADAELLFDESDGVLNGLRLLGFAVWERRSGAGLNVTFPSRTYAVNGERRSFALLRPQGTLPEAQDAIRALVLQAYEQQRQTRWEIAERPNE